MSLLHIVAFIITYNSHWTVNLALHFLNLDTTPPPALIYITTNVYLYAIHLVSDMVARFFYWSSLYFFLTYTIFLLTITLLMMILCTIES